MSLITPPVRNKIILITGIRLLRKAILYRKYTTKGGKLAKIRMKQD